MTNLITNRIKFGLKFPEDGVPIYSTRSEALFRLKYKCFVERLKGHSKLDDFECWFGDYNETDVTGQPYVYFEFREDYADDGFQFILDEAYFQKFKKHFIKQILIEHFKNKNIFIEPYPVGVDFSIYVFNSSFDQEWDIYSRYDFIIKSHRNEIIFNKTSENILISKTERSKDDFPNVVEYKKLRAIEPHSLFIRKVEKIDYHHLKIIANYDIRKIINGFFTPKRLSYKELYNDLKNFYSEYLLDLKSEIFKIQSGGFVYVNNKDVRRVYNGSNLMVFKDGQTDVNAATGIRNYGPFQPSPKARDVQFIFIYENSDDANKLYRYLVNGLKHFPGLQTYVGIPVTLADNDLNLKYTKKNLKQEFNQYLSEKIPNKFYDNYFVIFIGPFKKNYQVDDFEEQKLYYYIKKELLKKSLSSQFIFYKNIRSDQFHFHLPNIATAILAKLGGIPWKLKEQPYNELIIGFNTKKVGETQYIGSAVFFDNQGKLKKVNSYEGANLNNIVNDLKNAIENFREEHPEEELKRIIIHTYKAYGKVERTIEQILREELLLDVPFIYIEINEAKTTTELCFDESYQYGMPISGTYIKTGKNEFLLFNNTRYHERPIRSIIEEWPIKIRIYAHDYETIDEIQLISQIYEFSRLYWRGLKQKSQPVTTIYSKLIADFAGNFGGEIPKNKVTQQTPWFL